MLNVDYDTVLFLGKNASMQHVSVFCLIKQSKDIAGKNKLLASKMVQLCVINIFHIFLNQ